MELEEEEALWVNMFTGNSREKVGFGAFLAIVLSGCSSGNSTPTVVRGSTPDDPLLDSVVSQIEPADRANVLFIDSNGRPHTNNPRLLDGYQAIEPIANSGNMFISSAGQTFAGPPIAQRPVTFDGYDASDTSSVRGGATPDFTKPTTNKGSGPYRRIWSKPGYAYESGSVYIGCSAAGFLQTKPNGAPTDTAYAYLGGWGVTGSSAVDAGLQGSSTPDGDPADDNYALFIKEAYHGSSTLSTVSHAQRFSCGQTITLKFYPTADGDLMLNGVGTVIGGGSMSISLMQPSLFPSDWPITGDGADGVVVKRMTSIGQSNRAGQIADQPNDGSWFGYNPGGPFTPTIYWSSMSLATTAPSGGATPTPWTSANNGGTESYPCVGTVGTTTGEIYFTIPSHNTSASEEYDGIFATPCPIKASLH